MLMVNTTSSAAYASEITPPISVSVSIEEHLRAVHADEANFGPDGEPIDQGAADKSLQAENAAFERFISAPCLTVMDVQRKVHYVLHGTVGERSSLLEMMELYGHLEKFIRSLELAPPAKPAAEIREHASDRETLSDVIEAYVDGLRIFNNSGFENSEEEDARLEAETFGPPMQVLKNWDGAAQTFEEAKLALRVAVNELEENFTELGLSLAKAAAGYFDPVEHAEQLREVHREMASRG